MRCLGDDDNIYVRHLKLEGELPATLTSDSAVDALHYVEQLAANADTRARDAENETTIARGELVQANDTIVELRQQLDRKDAELAKVKRENAVNTASQEVASETAPAKPQSEPIVRNRKRSSKAADILTRSSDSTKKASGKRK